MKHSDVKKIVYALVAVVAIVVFGAMAVYAYQTGNDFIPSGSDRGFNANQVSFSSDSDMHDKGNGEQDGESELWEKDKDAEDTRNPQNSNNANYLFRTDTALPDGLTDSTMIANGVSGTVASGTGNGNGTYTIIGDRANADIIISGGNGSGINGSNGNGNGTSGNGNGSHAGNQNTNGNSGTTNNGNQGNTSGGKNNSSSGDKNTPDTPVTPEKPNYSDTAKDPEPGNNSSSNPIYSEDVTKPAGDPDEDGDYQSVTITKPSVFSYKPLLYKGQTITKKLIYASLEMFVWDSNFNQYEFGNDAYEKYIRITGISFDGGETWITEFPVTIPEVIEEGMMIVRAEYRISTKSDKWIKRDVSYDPESVRLFVLSKQITEENYTIDEGDIVNLGDAQYPETGSFVNLYRYIGYIVGWSGDRLTQLFPGWTENGKLMPFRYEAENGRHILEPEDMVDLDDDYYVKLEFKWMDEYGNIDDDGSTLAYLQTLKNYKSDSIFASLSNWLTGRVEIPVLKVPKYIQSIDMDEDADVVADYIDIPSTVIYINNTNGGFRVKKGYIVDPDNEYYYAEDGVLCNKAKTEVLGIPYQITHLEIPDVVEKINLDKYNSVANITFEAESMEDLPEIEYDNIRNCKITVDEKIFDSFLAEYYENFTDITGNSLASSADPDVSYHVSNGLLVSNEGRLVGVMESGSSNIMLTDSIKIVGAGTFEYSPEITEMILDDNIVPEFEAGCFDGGSVNTIFCHTQEQYDSVVKQLKELGITDIQVRLLSTSKEGFAYIVKNDGNGEQIVLVSAPDGLKEFDGTVTAGDGSSVVISEINDGAFADSEDLEWVTLPESVKLIGNSAFKNCNKLKGVLIDSKDDIRIENKAFDNCRSLRFIASNAINGSIADGYIPYVADPYGPLNSNSKFFFALPDAEGYEEFANQLPGSRNVIEYTLEDINGGASKVLYASGADGTPWVALRAEKELPDEVVLPESTIEIYYCAFADSVAASGNGSFTIANWKDGNIWSIGSGAFKNSELAGDIIVSNESTGWDLMIGAEAFAGCNITSIDVKGILTSLGESVFMGCESLEKASFEEMTKSQYIRSFFYPGTFTGCDNLTDLVFNCLPSISVWGTTPFQFNYDWDQYTEAQTLNIHLPEGMEEQCVYEWRYAFAGYTGSNYDNAYMQMRDEIRFNNIDWETWEYPSEETVDAILFNDLLDAENRVRMIIGVDTVSEPTDLYQYHVDVDGNITLVAVPSYVEDLTLSYDQMDMPEGWFVDYIAASTFENCKNLKSVTVPEKLLGIESGVFAGVESDELTLKLESTEVPELQGASHDEPFTFGIDTDKLSIEVPEGYVSNYISSWAFPIAGYTDISDMFYTVYDEVEQELNGGDNGDSGDGDGEDSGDNGDIGDGSDNGDFGNGGDIFDQPFSLADNSDDDIADGTDDSDDLVDDADDIDQDPSYEEIYAIVYQRMTELLIPAENTLRAMLGVEQITDPDDLVSLKGYEVIDLENEISSINNKETIADVSNSAAENSGSAAANENAPSNDIENAASDDRSNISSDLDAGDVIKPDDADADTIDGISVGSSDSENGDEEDHNKIINNDQLKNDGQPAVENGKDREEERAE